MKHVAILGRIKIQFEPGIVVQYKKSKTRIQASVICQSNYA